MYADVVELVDTHALGACAFGREGSSPFIRTKMAELRKLPPSGAAISVILPFWCNFTLLREPNFSGAVSKLSLNACGRTHPLATARHTLCLFFGNFPPPNFIF